MAGESSKLVGRGTEVPQFEVYAVVRGEKSDKQRGLGVCVAQTFPVDLLLHRQGLCYEAGAVQSEHGENVENHAALLRQLSARRQGGDILR